MPKNEEVSLASLGIQRPYSMQAEQSVLGAALVDETVLNRLITDMEPEMFYSDQNRAIYETMRSLYTESEAVDIVTLVNALASNKTFASADDAKVYLARIAETLPSVSNVDSYFKIVKEKYQGRRLIDAARSILNETASGEDADLLLESAEQKIYDIRSGRDKSGVKTIRESILEVIDTMQKLSGADRDKFAGIPTGFNYLDTVLTGLGRSDLIILAARPGMGKTSFALNIATNVARQQKVPTIIFSLEMTCEQLTDRILSSTANIDSQAFRTGRLNNSDWNDFAQATSLLYNAPIYMDDSSGISVPEIKAKIRTINQDPKKEKIGLVIIDYLQLMQSAKRTESRVQEISDITRNLKIMAKELNVPVIALSQLSRAAEKHRLSLVGHRVGRGNDGLLPRGQLIEPAVAQTAGPILARAGRHLYAFLHGVIQEQLHAVPAAEVRHKVGIAAGGLAPDAVVDVGRQHLYLQRAAMAQ